MRRAWLVTLVILAWSVLLGLGLAQPQSAVAQDQVTPVEVGTVDVVPPALQYPQEIYLERCGSCHFAIPPAVLPSQTWRQLLLDPEHYAVTLPPLVNPDLALTWRYLQTYSRPQPPETTIPYRVGRSKAFRILHPRVDFSEPVTLDSCISCHPAAPQFNFRKLTAPWNDAP